MQGYDAEKALEFIQKRVNRKPFAALGNAVDGILRQAQALDLRYMRENAVIDEGGFAGDGFYDDDEAFEEIVEEIVKLRGLSDEQAVLAAALVDQYMAAQEDFLRRQGLVADEG